VTAPIAVAIEPFGERAWLVTLGRHIDPVLNVRVHQLAELVNARRAAGEGGLGAPVAGYASLLVPFDPSITDADELAGWLAGAVDGLPEDMAPELGRLVEITVRYGGSQGPDLSDVAEWLELSEAEVVRLHQSVEYRVYMLGFSPGFAYLGLLPARLELPRRETPRSRVPAGSVAIAARQTAVYPLATPGGWHLIGRTDAVLWDTARQPPALLAPGARVRFVAG
jgi:KipI family sensor histidine kinase inhibitor